MNKREENILIARESKEINNYWNQNTKGVFKSAKMKKGTWLD